MKTFLKSIYSKFICNKIISNFNCNNRNKSIINNFNPPISIIARYFKEKCSKCCFFYIGDNIGKELDIITSIPFILKLLANLPILQSINLPALTFFFHLILA